MPLPYNVDVNATVDPSDVLECLNDSDIVSYLESRGYQESVPTLSTDAMAYYHGDFNLKGFLKEIGLEEARRVIQEIESEKA